MKSFKAFIKPLEAPQRSVKIKIYVNYFPLSGIGAGRVKDPFLDNYSSIQIFNALITPYLPKRFDELLLRFRLRSYLTQSVPLLLVLGGCFFEVNVYSYEKRKKGKLIL